MVERGAVVGADLRRDVERAEERERAARDGRARDVEMDVDAAATAEVGAAGDVEEAGELGEPVALPLGRDRGELLAEVVREHRGIPRAREGGACTRRRRSRTSRGRRRATTRWQGTKRPSRLRAQKLPAARAAPGAPASAASSPYVTTSPGGIARSAVAHRVEERRVVLEIDRHSVERVAVAVEVAAEPRDHFRDKTVPFP